MDHLHVVAKAFRVLLVGLADWLFGCAHRRTTFPMTLRARASVNGQPSTHSETYIVCLECGRYFAYNWTTMRMTGRRVAWAGAGRIQGGISEKDGASDGERWVRATSRG